LSGEVQNMKFAQEFKKNDEVKLHVKNNLKILNLVLVLIDYLLNLVIIFYNI